MITPVEYVPNVGGLPDALPFPSDLGSGLRALTRGGLAAVAAVGLEAFRRYAEEAAVQRSAERLGLDLLTVEGVLAAACMLGVNSIRAVSREPTGRGPVPRSWPKLFRCTNSLTQARWGGL